MASSEIFKTSDTSFYAKNSDGVALVTDATYQEVLVPDGVEGSRFALQVQTVTKTSYDILDDCIGFQWSSTGEDPGFLFSNAGKICPTPKSGGGSLGYVKAPAGYNIVCVSVI